MGLTGSPGIGGDGDMNQAGVAAGQRFFEGAAEPARFGAIPPSLSERRRNFVVAGTRQ